MKVIRNRLVIKLINLICFILFFIQEWIIEKLFPDQIAENSPINKITDFLYDRFTEEYTFPVYPQNLKKYLILNLNKFVDIKKLIKSLEELRIDECNWRYIIEILIDCEICFKGNLKRNKNE